MAAAQTATNERLLRRNEEKWTAPLMDAGWTVLPSIILEKQRALGLDPIDVNILLQLARHWWYNDNLPHPSKTTLAECMGVDPSTVRRRIAQMERSGFIRRVTRYDAKHGGQTSNAYEFEGLITAATPFAVEAINTREERRAEDAARRMRKKPKLVVDNNTTPKEKAVKKRVK
jgi:DNA-binding Lrp family transcriptional regulator